MEIKFFDRLKALERLASMVGKSEQSSTLSFYDALEKSAKGIGNEFRGDDLE